jgi:3D (Asp-Asp-Asp) domain-containing protein
MRVLMGFWTTLTVAVLMAVACTAQQEQRLTVTASAYNSTRAQTSGDPTEAAWGDRLEPGMKAIAVSDDLLERGLDLGTEVRIEGLDGTYTVLDRMASRHRNRIDIYMGLDVQAARDWGLQQVTIVVD